MLSQLWLCREVSRGRRGVDAKACAPLGVMGVVERDSQALRSLCHRVPVMVAAPLARRAEARERLICDQLIRRDARLRRQPVRD
jgi:hypothetical protein